MLLLIFSRNSSWALKRLSTVTGVSVPNGASTVISLGLGRYCRIELSCACENRREGDSHVLCSSVVTFYENGESALHIFTLYVELRMTVTEVYVQLCIKRFHVLFMSLCIIFFCICM
jgi:hypothetical protein